MLMVQAPRIRAWQPWRDATQGGSIVKDNCQLDPGCCAHQHVRNLRTLCLPCTISGTCSWCNVLKVELVYHADTCVVGQHVLVMQEHPEVVFNQRFLPIAANRKGKSDWHGYQVHPVWHRRPHDLANQPGNICTWDWSLPTLSHAIQDQWHGD